ncbi:hypothetical protein ACIGNX_34530 [Actinosynnema sp. NPDC053489]|uniref:hypothetical protein n=1 Tax=Actinosynnema sp. NPDC053489 TaxID=3363916 RepID=UPI0037CB0703
MTAHKPLSDWVARLDPRRPNGLDLTNDGDERGDARTFPLFADGWRRQAAVLSDGTTALALYRPDDDTTYVELDDYGTPLDIDLPGADLIEHIERSWPGADPDLTAFSALSRELRYLVLLRLNQEGQPSARLFHALDWAPVVELARAVGILLDGSPSPVLSAGAQDLEHWVTPAGSGITGPLEQLYEGLTAADEPALVVVGASGFCAGIVRADPARFPEAVASAFAKVAEALGRADPFLRHAAQLAGDRLTGRPVTRLSADLNSELPKAASREGNRSVVATLRDDGPLRLQVEVTAGGQLRLTVTIAVVSGPDRDLLVSAYGEIFSPVTLRTRDEELRYWVVLKARRQWLAGTLDVPSPRGRFTVDADAPPIGLLGLTRITSDELLRSLRSANNSGKRLWRDAARRSPLGHPLRTAVDLLDRGAS